MNKRILKVGSRTSALAMAQTRQIMDKLKNHYPDLEVEIIGIKVSADEGTGTIASQKPLWQLDAAEKNMFTRELDQALLRGEVDCTIHSFKDLSTDRPDGTQLAAVPERELPHDIVLFKVNILDHLRQGKKIVLGTSAPRRMTNVPVFLQDYLPQVGPIQIECKTIRGNVDSRIKRLFEPESSDRAVDAVVLALAGITRLHLAGFLHDELRALPKMLLPLSLCPGAPGQGALAIECRANDSDTLKILSYLNHVESALHVVNERKILVRHGGGCHQKFGASSITHTRFPQGILFVHGETQAGGKLNQTIWNAPLEPVKKIIAWDSMAIKRDQPVQHHNLPVAVPNDRDTLFISHSRAVTATVLPQLQGKRIFVPGVDSWRALAQKGLWIEGSGDGLGADCLQMIAQNAALSLPLWQDWVIITNKEASSGWGNHVVVQSYEVSNFFSAKAAEDLKHATHIFWGSSFQYDQYKQYAPLNAHNACGAGRTADHLEKNNVSNLDIFPSREEWQKWIKQCL